MENKIEEFTKAKNEHIEKLTKIKEMLRKKLDEAKNEISELKEEIDTLEEKISSIDQKAKPTDSVGNEQILEFLKGNRSKMDFVLKRLENLISIGVKNSENKKIPKTKFVKKAAVVKEYSEPEAKIEEEMQAQKEIKEKQEPPKPTKIQPPASKKLLSIPYPTDGTIRCPKCKKIKWKELENKSKMISRGVYAKQYYCKTCRTEWEFTY